MPSRFIRALKSLDLEERILNGAALFAAMSVFFPWMSGEWLGEDYVSYSGFESFTSLIGFAIFALNLALLILTFSPMLGGPSIVRGHMREIVRFTIAGQAAVLCVAAISVLTLLTHDYTRMEIRFGIWCTFTGCLVAAVYTFIRLQQVIKNTSNKHFHHPDDHHAHGHAHTQSITAPPPPPPPPQLEPEEHRIHP
jgi:hypothetical protein